VCELDNHLALIGPNEAVMSASADCRSNAFCRGEFNQRFRIQLGNPELTRKDQAPYHAFDETKTALSQGEEVYERKIFLNSGVLRRNLDL
jgi:hypothetical protein